MAAQDKSKDVLENANATENAGSKELKEDALKSVTGGLSNSTGSTLSSDDTATCVSNA
jgi:hypothetical protein